MTRDQVKSELLKLLTYCPFAKSGLLKNGKEVGTLVKGYWVINHKKCFFSAHVLIWEIHYGAVPVGYRVDHKDTIRNRNILSNFRLATSSQNAHNMRITARNKTGIKGLTFIANQEVWRGQIMLNGKQYSIRSKDRSEVENWLLIKRKELHGDFARNK